MQEEEVFPLVEEAVDEMEEEAVGGKIHMIRE